MRLFHKSKNVDKNLFLYASYTYIIKYCNIKQLNSLRIYFAFMNTSKYICTIYLYIYIHILVMIFKKFSLAKLHRVLTIRMFHNKACCDFLCPNPSIVVSTVPLSRWLETPAPSLQNHSFLCMVEIVDAHYTHVEGP
jgi:hypothetical protein